MPDWVTHLGTTYIATRAIDPKLSHTADIRYLLLGALLPDVTRFTVILVDILDWSAIETFTYFIPFHSLLLVSLIAGAMALLLPASNGSSQRAFLLIVIGTIFHFLLDDLEGIVGCGSTTFYPFYFGKPLKGWDNEGNFATALLVISAIGIGLALSQRKEWPPLTLILTAKRLIRAAGLLIITLIIPLFFQQWMINQNAYYLALISQPAAFTGQVVELCFSEVIALEPVTVEEFDTPFELVTTETLRPGEWITVRGIYQDGQIQPTILIRHRAFSDVLLSLIAAVAFIFLMLPIRIIPNST